MKVRISIWYSYQKLPYGMTLKCAKYYLIILMSSVGTRGPNIRKNEILREICDSSLNIFLFNIFKLQCNIPLESSFKAESNDI